MTTRLDYERLNTLIPAGLFEEMEKYEDEADECQVLEPNKTLKAFISHSKMPNGKKMTAKYFGEMIGIRVGNTTRSKLSGYSKFSDKELSRIHDFTHIDLDTLRRENPETSKKNKAMSYAGCGKDGSIKTYIQNRSGVGVEKIYVYPCKCDKEFCYEIPKNESLNNITLFYEPKYGRYCDIIIDFTNGTQTFIDDMEFAAVATIMLKTNNEYALGETNNDQFILLVRDQQLGEYFNAMYLNRAQTEHFINKYGHIHAPLDSFLSAYGGRVCDGKYYIIEDC